MSEENKRLLIWIAVLAAIAAYPQFAKYRSRSGGTTPGSSWRAPSRGDLSPKGGSATIREGFSTPFDDPSTSNDEGNDQPVGHFGSTTLIVEGPNGNQYTLDADLEDLDLIRLYFPRGGWIDFPYCELDEDFSGYCDDEEGREWYIVGE